MVVVAGAVVADLSANSAAFSADMGKARRALSSGSAHMNRSLARLDTGFGRMRRSIRRGVSGLFSMRGALATLAGGTGLGLLVKTTVMAASNVEEMQSKFAAVFKAAGDDAEAWARRHGAAVNRSTFDLQGYLATFQDTFVPLGFAREEAAGLSKTLVELAVDLASFNNAAEPETIQLLTSALVGNHEAVRRFGIVITENSLKAELLRSGIAKNVKQATELEKVMGRVNLIMAGSADAQGDALKTADQFANKLRGLDAAWTDLSVTMGQIFMPVARDSVNKLTEWTRNANNLITETPGEAMAFLGREIAKVRAELANAPGELEVFGVGLSASAGTAQALTERLRELEARLAAVRVLAEKGVSLDAFGGPGPKPPAPTTATPAPALDKKQIALLFPEGTEAGLKAASKAMRDLTLAENEAFFQIVDTTAAMDRKAAQTFRLIEANRAGSEAVKHVTAAIKLENEALSQGVDRTTEQGRAWEAAFIKAQQMESGLAALEAAQQSQANTANIAGEALASTLDRVSRGYTDLRSLALGVLSDIIRKTLDLAQANSSLSFGGGGGGLGSILSSAFSLFGGGGASAQVAGDFAGQVAFSTPFAHGGSFMVPGSGGPDSQRINFNATPGERVTVETPAQQSRGRGGDIVIHQSFDFRGADSGVFAQAQLFKRQIMDETVAAVFAVINDGGEGASISGRRARR